MLCLTRQPPLLIAASSGDQGQLAVYAARRSSDRAWPFDQTGISAVGNVIEGSVGFLKSEGIVDSSAGASSISLPSLSDIPDSDRENRILDFVDVAVRLTGQIHLVNLDLNIDI